MITTMLLVIFALGVTYVAMTPGALRSLAIWLGMISPDKGIGERLMHICLICLQEAGDHSWQCHDINCEQARHWPPLCCPGCPCESFEEAHRVNADTRPRAS